MSKRPELVEGSVPATSDASLRSAPLDKLGEPGDKLGEPGDKLGEPGDKLGEPGDKLGEPGRSLGGATGAT